MIKKKIDFFVHPPLLKAYLDGKRYTVSYGGRGSGKSFQMGFLTILFAIQNPGSRILCVRGTQNKISESSLQILKDVIEFIGYESYFEQSEHTLECSNGSNFLFYGAKNYHSFKSLQGIDLVFVDEATELSKAAWEILTPTIRNDNSRFLISFNPELIDDWVYERFVIDNDDEVSNTVIMNYPDNPYFPKVLKVEMLADKKRNYTMYLHKWMGELLVDNENALFDFNDIKRLSDDEMNNMQGKWLEVFEKLVVSVDPSTTNNENSDACGIVVIGKYHNQDRYCVIRDETKVGRPSEWSKISIDLYHKYDAQLLVYEGNQGGLIVEDLIRLQDKSIRFKKVHAKNGKTIRAESVQSLYEQGKVDHFINLGPLENEMITWSGKKGQPSPNRMDALVWGLKVLSGRGGTKMGTGVRSLY